MSQEKRIYMRRRISEKEIYEVSLDSLMECVDVISNGNIINHVAIMVFKSVGKFGVDGKVTLVMIAEYLATQMVVAERKELFGRDVYLVSKDAFLAYFSMCPSYSWTAFGEAALKYVTAKYEIINGQPVRKQL